MGLCEGVLVFENDIFEMPEDGLNEPFRILKASIENLKHVQNPLGVPVIRFLLLLFFSLISFYLCIYFRGNIFSHFFVTMVYYRYHSLVVDQ